ncbi:Bacterio-opsin activator HTH domain protein [Halorubrum aidingense JCM 13560]|uniref:Bacterio-opsin activator HTH domain protein n=1 Tax=Halorubrum aidingense JCM 13560 TaxID=1230454 RepID=M0PIT4_9EURY|nr:helix-turn-helix domain-containing protein [Halorubrum aidingense]EMA68665.1 Bacterio-opsin activator HTH domain protein [Halorubrum aidingense JCM 13560]
MPQARLLVDLPEGPWIADVSRAFPDAGFRILTAVPGEGAGFALVQITARDTDAVLTAMDEHDALASVSVMARGAGVATVRIETDAPLLLLAAKRSGLPIEMPLDVGNGVARVEVTGEHERVAALGRHLGDLGLEFDVECVRQRVDPERLLTDRQREILLAAVELGYYDVPRRATLTAVADHVGIAKSTCSELLQRVERAVVGEFVERLPRPLDADPAGGDGPVAASDGSSGRRERVTATTDGGAVPDDL